MAKILLLLLLTYFLFKIIRTFLKVKVYTFKSYDSTPVAKREIDITDRAREIPMDEEKNSKNF
jgi:hypothetical protein